MASLSTFKAPPHHWVNDRCLHSQIYGIGVREINGAVSLGEDGGSGHSHISASSLRAGAVGGWQQPGGFVRDKRFHPPPSCCLGALPTTALSLMLLLKVPSTNVLRQAGRAIKAMSGGGGCHVKPPGAEQDLQLTNQRGAGTRQGT